MLLKQEKQQQLLNQKEEAQHIAAQSAAQSPITIANRLLHRQSPASPPLSLPSPSRSDCCSICASTHQRMRQREQQSETHCTDDAHATVNCAMHNKSIEQHKGDAQAVAPSLCCILQPHGHCANGSSAEPLRLQSFWIAFVLLLVVVMQRILLLLFCC